MEAVFESQNCRQDYNASILPKVGSLKPLSPGYGDWVPHACKQGGISTIRTLRRDGFKAYRLLVEISPCAQALVGLSVASNVSYKITYSSKHAQTHVGSAASVEYPQNTLNQ